MTANGGFLDPTILHGDFNDVDEVRTALRQLPDLTLDDVLGYPVDRLPLYFEYRKAEPKTTSSGMLGHEC